MMSSKCTDINKRWKDISDVRVSIITFGKTITSSPWFPVYTFIADFRSIFVAMSQIGLQSTKDVPYAAHGDINFCNYVFVLVVGGKSEWL